MPAKTAKKITTLMGLIMAATDAVADHPSLAFGNEATGTINTLSAEPMPEGRLGLGIRSEIIDSKSFSNDQLEGFAAQGLEGVHGTDGITTTSLSIAYGMSEDLTFVTRLPYVERMNLREGELEDGAPEAHMHGDSSGWGDLALLGQYRFFKEGGTQAAILMGLKAPTGKTDVQDNDGVRFGTEFQPGSGSWDIQMGAAATQMIGRVAFHASVLYNKTTEGSQSAKIGDVWSYSLALSHRLQGEDHAEHGHQHADSESLSADLLLELNGETRRKSKLSGALDANSGGTTVYLSPGIKISSRSGLGGFLSIGIPVVKEQNGRQADIDRRIVAGLFFVL